MTLSVTHYTLLYCATLIVHVVFMNYVLGGTAYLAYRSLRKRLDGDPIIETARDWMPFVLSAAITAGIAPLLFLQILHQGAFYTANLLLFHRWMSIVPVLIVGFYLMYLLKSRPWHSKSTPLLAIGSFVCIAWTGLSWTENHLLSLESQSVWASFYESKAMWFRDPRVGLRFAVWLAGSLPTFAMLMAWQFHRGAKDGRSHADESIEDLGRVATVGLSSAGVAAALYFLYSHERPGWLFGPVLAVAVALAGGVAQVYAWRRLRGVEGLSSLRLCALTTFVFLTMAGATWLREIVRGASSQPIHAEVLDRSGSVGGFAVFAGFLVLSALLIAFCLRIANRPPSMCPIESAHAASRGVQDPHDGA